MLAAICLFPSSFTIPKIALPRPCPCQLPMPSPSPWSCDRCTFSYWQTRRQLRRDPGSVKIGPCHNPRAFPSPSPPLHTPLVRKQISKNMANVVICPSSPPATYNKELKIRSLHRSPQLPPGSPSLQKSTKNDKITARTCSYRQKSANFSRFLSPNCTEPAQEKRPSPPILPPKPTPIRSSPTKNRNIRLVSPA